VTRRQPALGVQPWESSLGSYGGSAPGGLALQGDSALTADGAVQRVDQYLNLDKLVAGPFGLVTVKGSGQHLGMRVPVLDHAGTGFIQRLKSLAHFGCFQQRDPRQTASASLMPTPIQPPAPSRNGIQSL
jgi:hypothetical protein